MVNGNPSEVDECKVPKIADADSERVLLRFHQSWHKFVN